MAHVGSLRIYPIKSLGGVEVERATIAPHGGFEGDRVLAMFDASGRLVNGKRTPLVHTAPATDDAVRLSAHLGFDVTLRRGAFPDHTRTPGPTVVTTATLTALANELGLSLDDARARFRANLEIAGTEPFEEDRWIGAGRIGVLRCGEVDIHTVDHCDRCIVPSRDPVTGTVMPSFARRFAQWRGAALPPWSDRATLPHFYHLALLTRAAGRGTINVGDEVRFLGWATERRTLRDRIAAIARRYSITQR
jgi:uncharacterized protein